MSGHPDFLPPSSGGDKPPEDGEGSPVQVVMVTQTVSPRAQHLLDRGLIYVDPVHGPQLTLPSRLLLHGAGAIDAMIQAALTMSLGALAGWLMAVSPLKVLIPEMPAPLWQITGLAALLGSVIRLYIPVDVFHSGFQNYLNEVLGSR